MKNSLFLESLLAVLPIAGNTVSDIGTLNPDSKHSSNRISDYVTELLACLNKRGNRRAIIFQETSFWNACNWMHVLSLYISQTNSKDEAIYPPLLYKLISAISKKLVIPLWTLLKCFKACPPSKVRFFFFILVENSKYGLKQTIPTWCIAITRIQGRWVLLMEYA